MNFAYTHYRWKTLSAGRLSDVFLALEAQAFNHSSKRALDKLTNHPVHQRQTKSPQLQVINTLIFLIETVSGGAAEASSVPANAAAGGLLTRWSMAGQRQVKGWSTAGLWPRCGRRR